MLEEGRCSSQTFLLPPSCSEVSLTKAAWCLHPRPNLGKAELPPITPGSQLEAVPERPTEERQIRVGKLGRNWLPKPCPNGEKGEEEPAGYSPGRSRAAEQAAGARRGAAAPAAPYISCRGTTPGAAQLSREVLGPTSPKTPRQPAPGPENGSRVLSGQVEPCWLAAEDLWAGPMCFSASPLPSPPLCVTPVTCFVSWSQIPASSCPKTCPGGEREEGGGEGAASCFAWLKGSPLLGAVWTPVPLP